MNVRTADIQDIETLIKLRVEYLTAHFGPLEPDTERAIRTQLAAYFAAHLNADFVAVLGEADGTAVSTAYLAVSEKPANPRFITGKTATLLNVFTYPEYRGKGYATAVLKRILQEAKAMNVSVIELSATEAGRPIYEKLGFTAQVQKETPMTLRLI